MIRRGMVAVAAFALLTLPVSARAATYFVDASRGDDANSGATAAEAWKTLAKANKAVAPGDTVTVRQGVYAGSVIAPEKSGTADARITYAAYEGELPEVTGGESGSIVNLRDKSYVTVQGLKIHSPTEHDWTVNLSGAACTNNRIVNCDVSDPEGYVCITIADGASYNEVVGCTVHDTGHADEQSGDCIVMNSGAHHNTIARNKCYNGCHSQIMALKGSHSNIIIDNECYSTDPEWAGAGINLPLGADNTVVYGNRIHDLGFITDQKCAIQIDSARNSIHHNMIYNVGAFGISPQSYEFRGTAQSSEGNVIANNTIYRTGRQGLFFVSKGESFSKANRILNNIIVAGDSTWYDKSARIMVFDTYHLAKPVTPGAWFDNVFKNNVFFHESAGESDMVLYSFKTGTKSWSMSELEKEFPGTFAGNLEADPRFVDAARGVFVLERESPALGAGMDAGLPFEGKAPDIGAAGNRPRDVNEGR